MKKTNHFIYNWLLVIIFTITTTISCNNSEWDSHYEQLDVKLDTNIFELLSKDQNYSTFLDLVDQAGYTNILKGSQTHTVWAPDNTALSLLSDEILNTPTKLKAFVENHITKSSYNTSSIDSIILVNMLNEKFIQFLKTGDDITFGNLQIIEKDLLTNNGIVHKINELLLVRSNIWTYLNEDENKGKFPILLSYFNQFNEEVFDEANSVRIGFNDSGAAVYDSVTRPSNTFFETIGNIDLENERYTFIGLNDDAYRDVYDDLKEFYKHPNDENTKKATDDLIFKNLNFSEAITSTLDGSTSITSTDGSELFIDSSMIDEDISVSNGNILVLNDLNYDGEEIIHKSIRYELEDTSRRVVGTSNGDLSISSFLKPGSSGSFSNVVRLFAEPKGDNNIIKINFSNVLSAKYDLNIRFTDIETIIPTKLDISLIYFDPVLNEEVTIAIPNVVVDNREDGVVKIGGPYDMPIYIDDDIENEYEVRLEIALAVFNSQTKTFSRQFGIDYVELTPAEEQVD